MDHFISMPEFYNRVPSEERVTTADSKAERERGGRCSLVICIEELLQPCDGQGFQSTSADSDCETEESRLLVVVDGKVVKGGIVTQLPSRPIFIHPSSEDSCIEVQLAHGCHLGVYACRVVLSIEELVTYGSPLYTSLWLGLARRGQNPHLSDCLERACLPDVSTVRLTVFDSAALESLPPASPSKHLRPNVKRALIPDSGEDGSCLGSSFAFGFGFGCTEVAPRIASVEGLMNCLDKSNDMVGFLQRSLLELRETPAERLQQLEMELEKCQREQIETQERYAKEVLDKTDEVDRLTRQLLELQSKQEQCAAECAAATSEPNCGFADVNQHHNEPVQEPAIAMPTIVEPMQEPAIAMPAIVELVQELGIAMPTIVEPRAQVHSVSPAASRGNLRLPVQPNLAAQRRHLSPVAAVVQANVPVSPRHYVTTRHALSPRHVFVSTPQGAISPRGNVAAPTSDHWPGEPLTFSASSPRSPRPVIQEKLQMQGVQNLPPPVLTFQVPAMVKRET